MSKTTWRAMAAVIALACGGATVAPAQAFAASCPNHTVTTVKGSPSYTDERGCILSFDGTPIVYNLYEPLNPKAHSIYTILEGPGFADAGGAANEQLLAAGYGDMTWDPRGFGQSGGYVEIDNPAQEGKDVSQLISQVLAGRPEIAVDTGGKDGQPRYRNDTSASNTYGQPVVGMSGTSYGGGIQLAVAAYDNRVKAIVPGFTWNDLRYSLFPNGLVKTEWDSLLFGAGTEAGPTQHGQGDIGSFPDVGGTGGLQITGGIDPSITTTVVPALADGIPTAATASLFGARSMAVYGAGSDGHVPHIPTLLVQGLADTLFNANEAIANAAQLRAADPGTPVKLLLQCLGHTNCPGGADTDGQTAPKSSPIWPGESSLTAYENSILGWFGHYLRGTDATDGMPADFVYQDQTGSFYGLDDVPTPAAPGQAHFVSAPLSGSLVIDPVPTGGLPVDAGTGGNFPGAALSDAPTSAADPGQVTVPVLTAPAVAPVRLVGVGHVTADVNEVGGGADLYFRLIDKATGDVIDLQTQGLHVDAGTTPVSLDLIGVGYTLPAGDTLELQVSTSTTLFTVNKVPGTVSITNGRVEVPVVPSSAGPTTGAASGGPTSSGGCPRATGTVSGTRLGFVRLGMTRAQSRAAYGHRTVRSQRYQDLFCLSASGVRVGYASSHLLTALPRPRRAGLAGRVVLITTANRAYALRGIRAGMSVRSAARALHLSRPIRIGANTWYVAPDGAIAAAIKTRGGVVQEIGMADREFIATAKLARRFLSSF